MTATVTTPAVSSVPASSAVDVAPATRFRRRALGVSVIAGSALALAGFATTVWEKGDKKVQYLDSLVVNPTQSQVAAILLHFGYMMFVPAMIVLAAMSRRRNSTLANVGLILGASGALSLPGLLVTDFYDLAIRQTIADDKLAVAVSDKASSYGLAQVLMAPALLALALGMVVLLIAAWRAGWLPVYLAPVFLVGYIAPAFLGAGWVANVVPTAFALVAVGYVGVRALRMSDREFVSGEHDAR